MKWDLTFKKDTDIIECCPDCAYEILVDGDGTTTCPECGHKNVLPCSGCTEFNAMEMCDWSRDLICTPYRKEHD